MIWNVVEGDGEKILGIVNEITYAKAEKEGRRIYRNGRNESGLPYVRKLQIIASTPCDRCDRCGRRGIS